MQHATARRLREEQDTERRTSAPGLTLVEPAPGTVAKPAAPQTAASRRTVRIAGQPGPRVRRRSTVPRGIAARPDRVALWAFLLGLFLVVIAAATAQAAPA